MAAFTPALAKADEANFGVLGKGRERPSAEPKGLSGAQV